MSSGFVSSGTNEQPIERDDEWLRAQQELEEERRRKAEIGKQDDGKSLFEVLERNKMAKQEAFEEKSRLKNQFRSLDEDEVEFLDSVLESTRAKEAAVKRETAEQLEAFRRQREEAEKALLLSTSSDVGTVKGEEWTALARKRRHDKHRNSLIPGKKRKASVTENAARKDTQNGKDSQNQAGAGGSGTKKLDQGTSKPDKATPASSATASESTNPTTQPKLVTNTEKGQVKPKSPPKPPQVSLGLGGYSSDSE
ncbi:NEFA-interacting nuclear protein NIP30, N-terminal [Penicillium italicum]|uniref:NEFA-interacting nuclear protein NIP30, N-terminal n=1 Tax=Penicillium italicum TaxID=40296 RepID=A0A0A2L7S1_PENIT|nr:NEFA-interacting nuclear protein NIP30, N-terminal [Penicillium italicum]